MAPGRLLQRRAPALARARPGEFDTLQRRAGDPAVAHRHFVAVEHQPDSVPGAQPGHAAYTPSHTTGVAATVQRMVTTFEPNERSERAYALMETLRMIVTQQLVPKKNGGRMGVREWMKFPDEVREKLLDMDFLEWGPNIQRMIPRYGQTMAVSASQAFEAGLIDRRWYLLLTSSTGAGG